MLGQHPRFVSRQGLGATEEISRLDRHIELTLVEILGHESMLSALRAARYEAMNRGRMTRDTLEEVRLEIQWRVDTIRKYKAHLERMRAQRRIWVARRYVRRPTFPRIVGMAEPDWPETVIDVSAMKQFRAPRQLEIFFTRTKRDCERAMMEYRLWLLADEARLRDALITLRGRHLLCADPETRSTADVLLELCNMLTNPTRQVPMWATKNTSGTM